MTRKIHKFYTGSSDIARAIQRGHDSPHTCATFDDAVKKARQKLETESEEMVIIVKIVAIVRRKDQPIVVEKVR